MKAGNCRYPMKNPLTRPTSIPTKRITTTPSNTFCVFISTMQPIMPDRPSVAPTDKSMPEVMMTMVMPMAKSAVEDTWLITFMMFFVVRK